MSTWDDKPNDYDHAVRLLETGEDEIRRLRLERNQFHAISDYMQIVAWRVPAFGREGFLLFKDEATARQFAKDTDSWAEALYRLMRKDEIDVKDKP